MPINVKCLLDLFISISRYRDIGSRNIFYNFLCKIFFVNSKREKNFLTQKNRKLRKNVYDHLDIKFARLENIFLSFLEMDNNLNCVKLWALIMLYYFNCPLCYLEDADQQKTLTSGCQRVQENVPSNLVYTILDNKKSPQLMNVKFGKFRLCSQFLCTLLICKNFQRKSIKHMECCRIQYLYNLYQQH